MANVGVNTISAIYTDANGCQGSAQLSIIVEQCASLENLTNSSVAIFPNPNGGVFRLNGFDEQTLYHITDFNGKVLFVGFASNNLEITIPEISSGFYYLTGISNGQSASLKIAVLK